MMELEEDTLIGVCVGVIISLVVAAPIFTVLLLASFVNAMLA